MQTPNEITFIQKPYLWDIKWEGPTDKKLMCEVIIDRLKNCEKLVHDQLDKGPTAQQKIMKIAGIVIIALAALTAAFAIVGMATSFLPFTAILILAGSALAVAIPGIVLTILGLKENNVVQDYLDNCPYYQGLTHMLNGEYSKAAKELQNYTQKANDTPENRDVYNKLNEQIFNHVNTGITLSDTANPFQVATFYFVVSNFLRIRELDIYKVIKNGSEDEKAEYETVCDDYNYNKKSIKNFNNFEEYCHWQEIKDVCIKVISKQSNPSQDQLENYKNLIIPSLKTKPEWFKISPKS